MIKYGRRFWISWLTSALAMYGLSYFWHGIFLNDYKIMHFPQGIFLAASAVVYLFISLLITRFFISKLLDRISRQPLVRGMATGFGMGILVYFIVLVAGVSFSRDESMQDLLLDLVWQPVEQTIGGAIVGLVYMFVYEPIPDKIRPEEEEEVTRF